MTTTVFPLSEHATIDQAFFSIASSYPERPFLVVPPNPQRAYDPEGRTLSYGEAARLVRRLMDRYAAAGYGHGHRIALLLESRIEHLLHKLAMNALGACCVPINPDYRSREIAYLIDHARVDLVVVLASREHELEMACAESSWRPACTVFECSETELPQALKPSVSGGVKAETPASILYTSGTTGRPKGCVLSHRYELAAGEAYANRGGLATLQDGLDRIYNPLPLFHVNSSILSFYAAMLTGNCQIQTDRFQPSRWWEEIRTTQATVIHYLGVIIQMLHGLPPGPEDRNHCVRFGIGAGVEPQIHQAFEDRFGFPLIEVWAMTENVRFLADNMPPRQVGTRAFGRAWPGLDVRVVDDLDEEVPDRTPGEMLIRHSEATPRKDFFSGYLDDPSATEDAWRGGWFHTGDVVVRDQTGMLHFVDRRKNIIRRSGENIAAAEVEAWLLTHPWCSQAAVMAVPDEVREEEVLACIVLTPEATDQALQDTTAVLKILHEHCRNGLAYFKVPGWIWFADSIPTTGTQKIQKHAIFGSGVDPRAQAGIHDIRSWKRQTRKPAVQ